jgi:hypothetical protein
MYGNKAEDGTVLFLSQGRSELRFNDSKGSGVECKGGVGWWGGEITLESRRVAERQSCKVAELQSDRDGERKMVREILTRERKVR